jgi:Asp-tRNA(Asn)/Glu-tRNA(Gln) amidotransferase A subunit family amidase
MQITALSATELAAKIRAGDLSPVAVVEAHIARIEAINPALNALVTPCYERARREAAQAEASAPRGPLHGVPITLKDSFDLEGVRSTCGLTARADYFPDADATAVARLRAAGAIVLGKTNTPDNCFDQETVNLLFGRTNNPWDVRRSVGGSTGGEAAIIAAGGSPLGIGSDVAGSIRMPAAFTGIVGLRPTSGVVPEAGFWPEALARLSELNGLGPMARRVEDAALAFAVLTERPQQPLDLDGLRGQPVAYWLDDGLTPSSAAVRGGVHAAVRALEQAGMRTRAGGPAGRRLAGLGWAAFFGPRERALVAEGFGGGVAWNPLEEAQRSLHGEGRVTPGSLIYWLSSHYGSLLLNALGVDGVAWRARLRAQLLELIGERGVAVCPIFPTTAPRHGWTIPAVAATIHGQAWLNLAGLPGLSLPVGRSRSGMPVGVQLVGGPGAEQTLLAAGLAVQRALMPVWQGPDL